MHELASFSLLDQACLAVWLSLGYPNPEGFFQTRVYGFDCCQTRVGLAYAVPEDGVNSAKISSVHLQHIKLAPVVQLCMHEPGLFFA